MNRIVIRRAFLAGQNALPSPATTVYVSPSAPRFSSSGRTVFASSFWKALVPKPLRSGGWKRLFNSNEEWNPVTFYIVVLLCIGSMSIQMIARKKDFETFMRQSDTRIGLLREVIEKIQKGEKVDVERVLGSGNPEREQEWEEVINEIERDEAAQAEKKRSRSKQKSAEPEPTVKVEEAPEKRKRSQADFF